jgi:hypothetical protein
MTKKKVITGAGVLHHRICIKPFLLFLIQKGRSFMKNAIILLLGCVLLSGCDGVRFAAREEQKQNAYLHWRVAELAAAQAKSEQTSPQLQGLTGLASQQGRAFVADYGMPRELPAAETAEQILNGSGAAIAATAYQQSVERPDVWQMADGAINLGIGLAGLLGGAYGIRATQFLKQAREKSAALKEIIAGNELFKQSNPSQTTAFKDAQAGQSAETRKIVTEVKTSS